MHTILTLLAAAHPSPALPDVRVASDNTVIRESCRIVIEPGAVIADADSNGVVQIAADGITVEFADGSELRGAPEGTPWDQLTGFGIRLNGHTGVTIRGARVHGFKGGVYATGADGLTVEGADLSDNYRAHLGSTPEREDSSDWLSPHRNDNNEWLNNYGAALYIEDSDGVTVRDVFIRRGQNGILLDRVNNSRVYDNDCSFLTGWGLGLWRASHNTVSRNHLDFCVRGHVEGVYNRGQDSAGILIFEQCSNNIIAENSITHGGDGIFGFAGLEALGENPGPDGFSAQRAGCNDNLFWRNDLSYAPAHGLEMTFSFGNRIIDNRFRENAICGIWGGFSQDTFVAGNRFEGNGGMTYGLERGAINIEHGQGNVVVDNDFINNRAAIHYWWDAPGRIVELPWGKENYEGVVDNVIAHNRFKVDDTPYPFHRWGANEKRLVLHIRDDGEGNVRGTRFIDNTLELSGDLAKDFDVKEGVDLLTSGDVPEWSEPKVELFGRQRPVEQTDDGWRSTRPAKFRGRDKIVMDEWGPWDHASPLVRRYQPASDKHVVEVLGAGEASVTTDSAGVSVEQVEGSAPGAVRATITAGPGVTPYAVRVQGEGIDQEIVGSLTSITWNGRVFSWNGKADPREDFDEFTKMARWRGSLPMRAESLDFDYGWGGPKDMLRAGKLIDTSVSGDRIETSDLENDHFGMELEGRVRLAPGRYRVRTVSDDGIRVRIADGDWIIDNWTHHGPTPNEGVFEVASDADETVLRVYHFEIDGYAMLKLSVDRLDDASR